MSLELFEVNGATKLGYLVGIDPKSNEVCCEGCGRIISQLKPFGSTVQGFGDLKNCALLENERPFCESPPQEIIEAIETSWEDIPKSAYMSTIDEIDFFYARVAEKLGCTEEEAEQYIIWNSDSTIIVDYFECRDCIRLGDKRLLRMKRNIFREKP
jgi:hypothetical protein